MGDKKIFSPNKKIRFNEYMTKLEEERKQEERKIDVINEYNSLKGGGLTSPTTSTTTEGTRLLTEYIDRANLFNISSKVEGRAKSLQLRKFFKSKRNQQVEVYFKCGEKSIYTEGKVSTIGRNFVMLTNLRDRMWIPYSVIESANIPYGIPNYSNTHQHFLFDNNLRKKLVNNFGEVVSNRDILKQQFYEEALITNLTSWKHTWVVIHLSEVSKKVGKIVESREGMLTITYFHKLEEIELNQVKYIETIRFFSLFTHMLNSRK